mmetsp:Transcript_38558/g.80803  ORF Transcript_38558/g.80803 Transcript_38558/m.80803 type:complete len:231 (+) Transcript_38558:1285-1977(+)
MPQRILRIGRPGIHRYQNAHPRQSIPLGSTQKYGRDAFVNRKKDDGGSDAVGMFDFVLCGDDIVRMNVFFVVLAIVFLFCVDGAYRSAVILVKISTDDADHLSGGFAQLSLVVHRHLLGDVVGVAHRGLGGIGRNSSCLFRFVSAFLPASGIIFLLLAILAISPIARSPEPALHPEQLDRYNVAIHGAIDILPPANHDRNPILAPTYRDVSLRIRIAIGTIDSLVVTMGL